MIALGKLKTLHGRSRIRKCALVLEKFERDFIVRNTKPTEERKAGDSLAGAEADVLSANAIPWKAVLSPTDAVELEYLRELAEFLAVDSESASALKISALRFLAGTKELSVLSPSSVLRTINNFRHELMVISGQTCADWDLLDYAARPGKDIGSTKSGRPFPGLAVYLEAVRSPFNVGTIFRTAEAFGFGEVILSPDCADPHHPRALRSSMGAIDMLPWKRAGLEALTGERESFALELGGTNVEEFQFPQSGILVLGSEELGVSSDALAACGERILSIPMRGLKASINVAVAFGIAANAWVSKFLD
jgi:TrmH family RNA methyltransferase